MFTRKSMADLGRKSANEARTTPAHPVLLILDDVRSMHNVGAAFRTADCFGIAGIYLCGYTPRPPHRDIHKTALGAEDIIPWQHFTTITGALDAAVQAGYTLVSVEQAQDSTQLQEYRTTTPTALIFGNEVTGVSDEALSRSQSCIEIPQYGAKHSLNISVSIGVVLWDFVRPQLGP